MSDHCETILERRQSMEGVGEKSEEALSDADVDHRENGRHCGEHLQNVAASTKKQRDVLQALKTNSI